MIRRLRDVTLAALSLQFALTFPVIGEPLGQTTFTSDEVSIWNNDNGEPGENREKVDMASVDKSRVNLVDWSEDYEMMLIDFGQGQVGWVKKADLVPPPSVCQGTVVARLQGEKADVVILGTRGLAEKACQ